MLPERVSADVEGAPHDALRPPPPLRPAHSCWTARPSACPGGAGARSPGGHQVLSILRSSAIPTQGREAIQAETHATPAIAPSRARVTRTRRILRLRRSPRARVVSGARLSSAAFTRGHASRRSPCFSSGPASRRSGSKPMSRSFGLGRLQPSTSMLRNVLWGRRRRWVLGSSRRWGSVRLSPVDVASSCRSPYRAPRHRAHRWRFESLRRSSPPRRGEDRSLPIARVVPARQEPPAGRRNDGSTQCGTRICR